MSINKKATEVKKVKKDTEVKKVDIQPIIKAIPDTFTPALLDKLFNLNDGGKTVRRHLRKHFAEAMEHEHKDKWEFTKANVDIIQYFADRYAYDLKVLEPATKTV
jgi:predicted transcriptional regulator